MEVFPPSGFCNAARDPSFQQESILTAENSSKGSDYECVCCSDILLNPVVAPCGHDMCKGCYQQWVSASNGHQVVCPLCRSPMPPTLGVCLRLKRTIETLFPADSQRRCMELAAMSSPPCQAGDKQDAAPFSGSSHAPQPNSSHQPAGPAPPPPSEGPQWHWAHQVAMAMYNPWTASFFHPHMSSQWSPYFPAAHPFSHPLPTPFHPSHPSAPGPSLAPVSPEDTSLEPALAYPYTATGTPVIDFINMHQNCIPFFQGRLSREAQRPAATGAAAAVPSPDSPRSHPPPLQRQQKRRTSEGAHPAAGAASSRPSHSITGRSAADGPASGSEAGAEVLSFNPSPSPSASQHRWQSITDVPQRLEIARTIVRLVHARGLQQVLGNATLAAARAVEVALYRAAATREEYFDKRSLEARVAAVVRSRASAAATRRAALRAASSAAAVAVAAQGTDTWGEATDSTLQASALSLNSQLEKAGYQAQRLSLWAIQGLTGSAITAGGMVDLMTEITCATAFNSLVLGEIPSVMTQQEAENMLADCGLLSATVECAPSSSAENNQGDVPAEPGHVSSVQGFSSFEECAQLLPAKRWLFTSQQLRLSDAQMGIYAAHVAAQDADEDYFDNIT